MLFIRWFYDGEEFSCQETFPASHLKLELGGESLAKSVGGCLQGDLVQSWMLSLFIPPKTTGNLKLSTKLKRVKALRCLQRISSRRRRIHPTSKQPSSVLFSVEKRSYGGRWGRSLDQTWLFARRRLWVPRGFRRGKQSKNLERCVWVLQSSGTGASEQRKQRGMSYKKPLQACRFQGPACEPPIVFFGSATGSSLLQSSDRLEFFCSWAWASQFKSHYVALFQPNINFEARRQRYSISLQSELK